MDQATRTGWLSYLVQLNNAMPNMTGNCWVQQLCSIAFDCILLARVHLDLNAATNSRNSMNLMQEKMSWVIIFQ